MSTCLFNFSFAVKQNPTTLTVLGRNTQLSVSLVSSLLDFGMREVAIKREQLQLVNKDKKDNNDNKNEFQFPWTEVDRQTLVNCIVQNLRDHNGRWDDCWNSASKDNPLVKVRTLKKLLH